MDNAVRWAHAACRWALSWLTGRERGDFVVGAPGCLCAGVVFGVREAAPGRAAEAAGRLAWTRCGTTWPLSVVLVLFTFARVRRVILLRGKSWV